MTCHDKVKATHWHAVMEDEDEAVQHSVVTSRDSAAVPCSADICLRCEKPWFAMQQGL